MASSLQKVTALYKQLTEEWNKRPMEKQKCEVLLNAVKVALTEHHFIPTTEGEASKQEVVLARDVLEMGAQFAIMDKDIKAFQRHIDQLKVYYYDVKNADFLAERRVYVSVLPDRGCRNFEAADSDGLLFRFFLTPGFIVESDAMDDVMRVGVPESAMMNQLLGLHLLSLLAENRLGDFHSEVELMSLDTIEKDPYLRFPVNLERCLVEGSFSKIFVAHNNVPAPSFNYFLELLAKTTRAEIAKCISRACPTITAETARKMLFFANDAELKKFSSENNWTIKTGGLFGFDTERNLVLDEINAMETDRGFEVGDHTALSYAEVADTMLSYARELEKIV